MRTITVREVSENPTSGLKRWKVSAQDAFSILSWMDGDTSRIRGYRAHKRGGFGFSTGGGYAILDADLLGGNGDGETERRFTRETGITFRAV